MADRLKGRMIGREAAFTPKERHLKLRERLPLYTDVGMIRRPASGRESRVRTKVSRREWDDWRPRDRYGSCSHQVEVSERVWAYDCARGSCSHQRSEMVSRLNSRERACALTEVGTPRERARESCSHQSRDAASWSCSHKGRCARMCANSPRATNSTTLALRLLLNLSNMLIIQHCFRGLQKKENLRSRDDSRPRERPPRVLCPMGRVRTKSK